MSPARVRKQIVCPECGRPLRVVPASAARVASENLPEDDQLDEVAAEPGSDSVVETIVEEGPVCPRCSGQ
ncbi:MAG: hypothetical protein FJX72_13600 [Armatimonadetes bacterium]|nr:hypothetical protein [Armatimonadota bacterium]